MKTKNIVILTLICSFAFGALGIVFSKTPKAEADFVFNAFAPLTQTAVLCVKGASTQLVATSTGREYIRISNLGAGSMYLGMGVPAATSTGVYLAASSTITFSKNDLIYAGAINCLTDSANATSTAVQYP